MSALSTGLLWLSVAQARGEPAAAERHFALRARVEPERVLPGGWIDVIAELELDPGWHATSPRSENGPRAAFTCRVPEGFVPLGDVLVEGATASTDPQLGKVELLEGRVELRRRYAVPAGTTGSASCRAELELGLTVCDPFRCLPRISVREQATLAVDPERGKLAPAPARSTVIAPPDERELRLMAEQGFAVRARQEGACAPGEAAFVLLEFLLEPGSTLSVRPLEPRRDSPAGFERLPLTLPAEAPDGVATFERAFRAYQVLRTSSALAPGAHAVEWAVSARPGRGDAWVEQRLSVQLSLSSRP